MGSRRRLRVFTVVNNLDVGGLERMALSLTRSLDPSRFEPWFVCIKGEGKLFSELSIPPERRLVLESNRPTNLGFLRLDVGSLLALRRFFAAHRPDIVHAHNFGPLIYAGIAAHAQLERPRIVYTEHNQVNSAKKSDLFKFRAYIKLADTVVTVSEDLRQVVHKRLGVSRGVRVIPNGIAEATVSPEARAQVRRDLGVPDDTFLFGTAVVLSEQKGITYLIEAARAVIGRTARARFVVAGDGPLRAALAGEATRAGLGDRFRFLGYQSDVPRLLAGLDAYVLPSLWEGLPLALLEATRAGLPIVATTVGGNREVVVDGVTGLLVPPADPRALGGALIDVVFDEALRARARAAGPQRFAERFSLRTMVERYGNLFEELGHQRAEARL